MMDIYKMTRKELYAVPRREWGKSVGEFDCLVLLPTRRKHDSGYGIIDAVACKKNEPLFIVTCGADVLNIEGIGGYGKYSSIEKGYPKLFPAGWSIDLLHKSGLFRLFCEHGMTCDDSAVSSFAVYSLGKKQVK